jgi:SAM-dependent methyltransferase
MGTEPPGAEPFRDHFSAVAAGYLTFRPRYPDALFTYLAGLVPRRALAWDCACGNGQATPSLAAHFDRVIGTDASAAQVAQASPHPRVEYRVALAERSGIATGTVDLVTVAQALHWLDLDRFYAEARRVLVPDGVLAVWTYPNARIDDPALNAALQQLCYGAVGPYWPAGRELAETGYRTLAFPFDELAPPAFEMTADWTLDELLGYVGTWSATRRYVAERGVDPRAAVREAIARTWAAGTPDGRRRVRWPLALRVGRASRRPAESAGDA